MRKNVSILTLLTLVLLVVDAVLIALGVIFDLHFSVYIVAGCIAVVSVVMLIIDNPSYKPELNTPVGAGLGNLVGMYTIYASGSLKIISCSDTFATLHGYANAQELMQNTSGTIADIITEESFLDVQNCIVGGIAEDKYNIEHELEIVLPDGHSKKLYAWGRLRREMGVWVIDGCVADLSKQKKLHQDLELLNDTLTAATSMLSSMVFLINIPEKSMLNLSGTKFAGQFFEYVDDFPSALLYADYILKDDKVQLLKSVEDLLAGKKDCDQILRMYSRSDSLHYMHLRTKTVFSHDGAPLRAIVILEDVTEEKIKEARLLEKAEMDPLTKIYNRQTVVELISQSLQKSEGAFLFLDLDEFKRYNDSFGHKKGDEKIAQIAYVMQNSVGEKSIVGRLAGDEFVIFLREITDKSDIESIAQMVAENVRALNEKDAKIVITVSIGISISPTHGKTFESLYICADKALYASKSLGKNTISFYKPIED